MKAAATHTPVFSPGAKVDLLNIGLMIVSFVVAVQLPVHLLLFSYAILGPLHYLTEIFWLREQQYFITNKRNAWLVVPFCICILIIFIAFEFDQIRNAPWFRSHINSLVSALFFVGFVSTISLVSFREWWKRLLVMALAIVMAILLRSQGAYLWVFGVLLSTIIHVSIFTFLFMLLGTLRSGSFFGYLALLVYIGCVVGFGFVHIRPTDYIVTRETFDVYIQSGFPAVVSTMAHHINGIAPADFRLSSAVGIRIQCFIAFAYTYHYLNWFSKVDIIRWNRVPAKVLRLTAAVWIASILIYAWDYRIGLLALLMLSLLHVFLEFPLNFRSMTGIAAEIRKKVSPR